MVADDLDYAAEEGRYVEAVLDYTDRVALIESWAQGRHRTEVVARPASPARAHASLRQGSAPAPPVVVLAGPHTLRPRLPFRREQWLRCGNQ